MYSAGAGKMHRSFASLKMTTWIDAVDSRDSTPENPAQVPDRDPFSNIRARGGQGVRRYDPSHALPVIERGPGVLLKSRYLRRSLMLTGRKLALTLAFTVLVALAFGAGCRGFFPKSVLQSLEIGRA